MSLRKRWTNDDYFDDYRKFNKQRIKEYGICPPCLECQRNCKLGNAPNLSLICNIKLDNNELSENAVRN